MRVRALWDNRVHDLTSAETKGLPVKRAEMVYANPLVCRDRVAPGTIRGCVDKTTRGPADSQEPGPGTRDRAAPSATGILQRMGFPVVESVFIRTQKINMNSYV